jgi:membrane associated rhomboid family serine protease
MARAYRPSGVSYSFGPGPVTPAVKALLIANIGVFLLELIVPSLLVILGLRPQSVIENGWLWQPVTYMFLHDPRAFTHILFNLLGIWMFGVELERLWGTKFFVRYYFITGVGAAATSIVASLIPAAFAGDIYGATTVGASGALYGLLLAYGYYYPDRPILLFLIFPIPAKYFVMIIGAISFLSAIGAGGGGTTAHATHLGGLVVGYIYLRGGRGGLMAELKYRWVKWKMNRLRRKFDVHQGGRDRWDRTVH